MTLELRDEGLPALKEATVGAFTTDAGRRFQAVATLLSRKLALGVDDIFRRLSLDRYSFDSRSGPDSFFFIPGSRRIDELDFICANR